MIFLSATSQKIEGEITGFFTKENNKSRCSSAGQNWLVPGPALKSRVDMLIWPVNSMAETHATSTVNALCHYRLFPPLFSPVLTKYVESGHHFPVAPKAGGCTAL